VGQVRWKIFTQHKILAILPSTYQNLLKLVEILRSSDRHNAQFFLDTVHITLLCYVLMHRISFITVKCIVNANA